MFLFLYVCVADFEKVRVVGRSALSKIRMHLLVCVCFIHKRRCSVVHKKYEYVKLRVCQWA